MDDRASRLDLNRRPHVELSEPPLLDEREAKPNDDPGYPYRNVHALILGWKDDCRDDWKKKQHYSFRVQRRSELFTCRDCASPHSQLAANYERFARFLQELYFSK